MELTESEVLQVLKLVEQSNFGELQLETGGLKLVVRKNGYQPNSEKHVELSQGHSPATQTQPAAPKLGTDEKADKVMAQREGTIPISSPMLGTVYRRPSPDAPAYVDVGSFVKEDDTVCLIEVMKVFTAVKAGIRGQITEILVETNDMVEYNQPMFFVKPTGVSGEQDS